MQIFYSRYHGIFRNYYRWLKSKEKKASFVETIISLYFISLDIKRKTRFERNIPFNFFHLSFVCGGWQFASKASCIRLATTPLNIIIIVFFVCIHSVSRFLLIISMNCLTIVCAHNIFTSIQCFIKMNGFDDLKHNTFPTLLPNPEHFNLFPFNLCTTKTNLLRPFQVNWVIDRNAFQNECQ